MAETIQDEDDLTCEKIADLAAGRPLASASTHRRRQRAKEALYKQIRAVLQDGNGTMTDKLLAVYAADAKSDAT